MSRYEELAFDEESLDLTTSYPESPAQMGWAPYKANPATFALTLAEHSGFDAVNRSMTPPPSYSRHALPPKLTVIIPGGVDEQSSTSSPVARLSPDTCAIESFSSSPIDASVTKQNEGTLLNKVKAGLKKRSTGIKSRLRRPSGGSRTSSASTSPSDAHPPSPFTRLGSFGGDSHPATPSHHLPAIQELDGQPVETRGLRSWAMGSGRTGSSSIVPTPRRGLSVAFSTGRDTPASDMDAQELTGRLESLRSHASQAYPELIVSPCSPASPTARDNFQGLSSLVRSNAVTDAILRNNDPVSPISAAPRPSSVPPPTPTLNGRLDSLPRLFVPVTRESITPPGPSRSDMPVRSQSDVSESDSGKEIVMPRMPSFGRLERPFSTPNWESPRHPRRAVEDSASDAPEVFVQENVASPAISPINHQHYNPIYTARPYVQPNSFASLVGTVCEAAVGAVVTSTNFLKSRYGPEPPVSDKHVRVRWRCTCGEHVYDDYIENRPGAAAELEAYLNRVPQYWPHSPNSSHPSYPGSPVFSAGGPSPLSSISSWPSAGPTTPSNNDFRNFSKQPTRIGTSNFFPMNLKSSIESLWLYTCVNEGKWTTKMRHLDVNSSKIGSDKDLALSLSSLYSQVNRRWYKFLKLRGLISIKFVQFELHRNRFADVSCSPALPSPHSPEGSTYEFTPHDLTPPVGSNYLMHLFKHPEDYDDEMITYQRTPKRRDRLEIGTGWGLELVEGFMAERVWGAFMSLLLIGSLVFAIVWACRKGDDMQGAFGVAGYIVGAGGLLVAWAQAVLD